MMSAMTTPFAPLAPAASLDHLERAVAAFDGVLAHGDLDAPVPSCPGWSLLDLTHHLGGVHRWATAAVVEKRPLDDDEIVFPDASGIRAWFLDGATTLVRTLRATPPETECWAFGPKPRTAAFWFRRQPLETVVHAWDAVGSLGTPGHLVPADLALDGIDEVRHMFYPRQVRLERIPPLARSLAVAPDDAPGDGVRWLFPAGDPLAPDAGTADAEPEAVVSGSAEDLYLLLWGRFTLDDPRFTVTGDAAAARAVLTTGLTP
jgi:uncharacterized protein (TIGR03083 family)